MNCYCIKTGVQIRVGTLLTSPARITYKVTKFYPPEFPGDHGRVAVIEMGTKQPQSNCFSAKFFDLEYR